MNFGHVMEKDNSSPRLKQISLGLQILQMSTRIFLYSDSVFSFGRNWKTIFTKSHPTKLSKSRCFGSCRISNTVLALSSSKLCRAATKNKSALKVKEKCLTASLRALRFPESVVCAWFVAIIVAGSSIFENSAAILPNIASSKHR